MVHLFHGLEVDIHSDIDYALVNSSMSNKISSVYFVDHPSISDHKPLRVYWKKTTTNESFFFFPPKKKKKKKKNLFSGIGIKMS